MKKTIAFDVYGTLIDTRGVNELLTTLVGEKANDFSNMWRTKQLEYSFRKALMRRYDNFSVCTRQALDYTCQYFNETLSSNNVNLLLTAYKTLPAFTEVEACLLSLKKSHTLVAFSNGNKSAVEQLLLAANIAHHFDDIVSTDDISSFKPNPDVYQHLLSKTASVNKHTWLISSNPFDILGAINCDLNTVWVRRLASDIFDPWDQQPNEIINSLTELTAILA